MQPFLRAGLRCFVPGVLVIGLFNPATAQVDIVSNLLGTRLACELVERELANMPVEALYQNANEQCVAVIPDEDAGAWFADDQCTEPVTYTKTELLDYCQSANNREELGNGLNIISDSWTLTPGNRLDLGARSLEGVIQPYMQRLVYRQVQTPRGRCDLEMRIYKKHPTATAQRSMIMLHGGSWTGRSFGYLGLELAVPHFVDQGFVVYSPFYRLLGNKDSSEACNQADFNEVVADANAALDWVLDNASQYGSAGLPVVFGQSAGGHLALSLAVNRPSYVSGAVLMYPPTDFTDFLQRIQSGAYTNPEGLSVLERVVGDSPENASLTLPLVGENSFPARIASEGGTWPPMFIVQGSSDELVEPRQAVRLCDALAGRELAAVDMEVGEAQQLRDVSHCGNATQPASVLHLIKLGRHALDVCINPNVPNLCLSGLFGSQALVAQSIGESADFAVAAHQANVDGLIGGQGSANGETVKPALTTTDVISSGGGGALGLMSLFLLLLVPKRRQTLQ